MAVGLTVVLATALRAQEQPPAPLPTPGADSAAVGDLLVAPTRIVLEGNQRAAEVTLVNIGDNAGTYRISLTHLRMTQQGQLVEIEQPQEGDRIADDLVRFSPRQVMLEPGVAQTVRIQVRKPAQLEPGEYRSHLLFRAIPNPELLAADQPTEENPEGVAIRLIPVYGVSIPLIVRHGETAVAASLADIRLDPADGDKPGSVAFRINREGNQSVYGDLKVIWQPPAGEERVVGILGGVAVYTPLEYREVVIPLQLGAGEVLRGGRIRVTYTGEGVDGELLADGAIPIP